MTRLPTPGSDNGTWGDILNGFLEVAHNTDGSLTTSAVQQAGAVTSFNGKTGNAVTLAASDVGASASLTPTAIKTANYAAAASDFVLVDVSGGSVTVTLPTTPADKTLIGVKLVKLLASNTVMIQVGGSATFNDDLTTTYPLRLVNESIILEYKASSDIWYMQSSDLPLNQLDARYASVTKPAGDGLQRIAVPSYFYPTYFSATGGWQDMEAAAPYVSIAIADPANGPGGSINTDYVTQIAEARAAGIRVLGYVTSSYAASSLASVKSQIDTWYNWYSIDGIFVDQVTTDVPNQPYYVSLYNYIKQKPGSATVLINPGTPPDESYMQACDICCAIENSLAVYATYVAPTWMLKYAADRFMHVIHDVTTEQQLAQALSLTRFYRAGYIYVTDDNTYTTLAGTNSGGLFWQNELAWVRTGGLVGPKAPATTAVTVASTASITSIGSLTVYAQRNVPTGTPVAGTKYAIKAFGKMSTDVSAPTFVLDLRWGGTAGTLITSVQSAVTANAPSLTASLSNAPVLVEGEITFLSATTCIAWLKMTWQNATSATTAPIVALNTVTSPVTVTTSSSQALSLDWTWGTSSASNSLSIASSSIERIA